MHQFSKIATVLIYYGQITRAERNQQHVVRESRTVFGSRFAILRRACFCRVRKGQPYQHAVEVAVPTAAERSRAGVGQESTGVGDIGVQSRRPGVPTEAAAEAWLGCLRRFALSLSSTYSWCAKVNVLLGLAVRRSVDSVHGHLALNASGSGDQSSYCDHPVSQNRKTNRPIDRETLTLTEDAHLTRNLQCVCASASLPVDVGNLILP